MKYIALFILIVVAFSFQMKGVAQESIGVNNTGSSDWNNDSLDISISYYDKFTPIIGGKEVRKRNGVIVNGVVKDYYPDSTLKHRGYYTQGKLITSYKNYYPSGVLERSYTMSGTFKVVIRSFYPIGTPKEYIEFRKGVIVKYIDYYPNGNIATLEEHDKKKGFYTIYKNYYPSGVLKSSLELRNRKKREYFQVEYYSSGKIKEEGAVVYNQYYYDYQRYGIWNIFDEKGKLIESQEYYKGELVQ
jgi:antitoxin component YwqK of YwqJK toxin-antitoxin module